MECNIKIRMQTEIYRKIKKYSFFEKKNGYQWNTIPLSIKHNNYT